jgi:hypothetical protein
LTESERLPRRCEGDAAERIHECARLFLEKRVPVTAKLSRNFYERLGDDIASELVDWFNSVDATYQTQLREMNDLSWERFKATLLAESASIRSDLRVEIAGLREKLSGEIGGLRSDIERETGGVRGDIERMRTAMEHSHVVQLRWLVGFCSGSLLAILGVVAAIIRTR